MINNKVHFKRQFLGAKTSQSTASCVTKVGWNDNYLDCSLILSDGFQSLAFEFFSNIEDQEGVKEIEDYTVIIDRLINQLQEYRNGVENAIKNQPKNRSVDLFEDDD